MSHDIVNLRQENLTLKVSFKRIKYSFFICYAVKTFLVHITLVTFNIKNSKLNRSKFFFGL